MTGAWLVRRLLGDVRRHRGVWLALAAAFAVAGFCAAWARLAAQPTARDATAASPEPTSRVIAYLNDDLSTSEVVDLRRALAQLPGVQDARIVSARDGFELLRRELGPRAALLEGVGPELLSASLEVVVRPASLASALALRLRRLNGISDVDQVTDAPGAPTGHTSSAVGVAAIFAGNWAGTLGAGVAALMALGGALGFLRARTRTELRLLLTLGVPRAAAARPALTLGTAAGTLGALVGLLAASGTWRAWAAGAGLPLREGALGATVFAALAFLTAFVALRAPEAVGAR